MHIGVVIVGHGQLPLDLPAGVRSEYLRLKFKHGKIQEEKGRFKELEEVVLNWPRNEKNDPYLQSLNELASEVGKHGGFEKMWVAFTEFCKPTLEEALIEACRSDVDVIVVVTTMITRGGEHADKEIRKMLEKVRDSCGKLIIYAWPFDVGLIARLIIENIRTHLTSIEVSKI